MSGDCSCPLTSRPGRVDWMWKSNIDPWSISEADEWCSYSDVATVIIEEAFQKKLPVALLDDYHIIFKHLIQISNNDTSNQRPVKRVINDRGQLRLREERFMSNALLPSSPCTHCQRNILDTIRKHFSIDGEYLVTATIHMLVANAAEGLVVEGEWLAQQLLNVKELTSKEVWICCVRLYCMKSFLYKELNEWLRLVVDKQHEELMI